jgi:DinB family protein
MDRRRGLVDREDAAWAELHDALDTFTPEQLESPTLNEESWSPKDVMFHIGAWLAEAGCQLERMCAGTFVEAELDIDEMNARWLEISRGVDVETAKAELMSSRTRLLQALEELPEITPQAQEWFEESGDVHYREHLPELRAALAHEAG